LVGRHLLGSDERFGESSRIEENGSFIDGNSMRNIVVLTDRIPGRAGRVSSRSINPGAGDDSAREQPEPPRGLPVPASG
jgi:hypothetical protein